MSKLATRVLRLYKIAPNTPKGKKVIDICKFTEEGTRQWDALFNGDARNSDRLYITVDELSKIAKLPKHDRWDAVDAIITRRKAQEDIPDAIKDITDKIHDILKDAIYDADIAIEDILEHYNLLHIKDSPELAAMRDAYDALYRAIDMAEYTTTQCLLRSKENSHHA